MDSLPLTKLAIISVAGTDRRSFLQGQLTQDLNRLTTSRTLLTGWTNPQGRLLLIGQLIERQADILIIVPRELADGIIKRLRMFVLRASVVIEEAPLLAFGLRHLPEDQATVVFETTLEAHPQASCDNGSLVIARLAGDPSRALLLGEQQDLFSSLTTGEISAASETEWQLANIDQGIPSVASTTSEAFIPQMVNLDLLSGISFSKGCYVGQEVIARTQNLGRIKRRMFRLASSTDEHLSAGDALLTAEGKTAGRIVAAANIRGKCRLLAVIQLAKRQAPLFTETHQPVEVMNLPYEIPLTKES